MAAGGAAGLEGAAAMRACLTRPGGIGLPQRIAERSVGTSEEGAAAGPLASSGTRVMPALFPA